MDVVSSFYRSYKKLFLSLSKRLNGLPIIIFYKYLYANDKPLLVQGLVVNYILPMVLEILPFWWVSSRKLGNRLRKTKIQLNHSMATGKLLNMRMLVEFLVLTVFHAVLDTAKQHLQNRTAIENRLLIRRLVFERLLYSEMGEFEKLRTLDIEYRISADISQTLSFFTYTLPQVVGSVYALVREGLELYRHRQHVDLLALLHPIAIGVLRKILGYFKYHLIEKKQRDVIHKTRTKMSRLVSNALDGLADIQVNNLQQHQLRLLDAMISTELSNSLGIKTLVARTWNLFSNRNVLEFVAEVYVVHKVMQRQQISHETYSKIQHDIHRVIDLAKRLYGLVRITRNMLEFQKEVVELVNIPNFLDEHKRFKTHIVEFRELRLTDVVFAYKDDAPPALCFSGSLVFEQGKQYAVIGQNRSGKSTLCKLICKLYQPMQGSISINDIPYNRISRVALRELISYVSQKPFLFPGTIRDNILIGNPDATEQEVYDAAEAAGVFAYGAYMLDATGGGMRRSVSMNDMKGSWRPSTPTPVPTSLSPPAEVATPSPSLPIGPPTFSRGRSEATLRRSLPPAVDPLDEDDPLTNPGAAALHSGDCEEEDVDHPDKTGTDAHASVEDSEEGGGLLYKAVNLVWEAEADFHSTYLRKKKKKDRDKEKKRLRFSTAPGRATHDEVPAGPGAAILDMKLTARGGNISGGFAQSVALARVFVKTKARVVILDEALGQMDPYKKRGIIYPALLRFVRRWGMTLIIVSHDMQSIEGVDVIYLLHQGALAHSGSHDQLLRDRAPLYLQMLGLDTEDDSEEGQEAPSGDSMAGDSQGDKRDTKGKARAASADRPFEGNGTAITSSKPPQSPRRVTFSPLPPRTSED